MLVRNIYIELDRSLINLDIILTICMHITSTTIHIISQIIEKGIMKAMQVFFIYNFYFYI